MCHKWPRICSTCRKHFSVLSSSTTYDRLCYLNNTTGATSGAGTAYTSGAPEFTPGFKLGSCYWIFSFICMLCRSLFVLFSYFFWPLCCLSSFDLRILITFWYLQTLFISLYSSIELCLFDTIECCLLSTYVFTLFRLPLFTMFCWILFTLFCWILVTLFCWILFTRFCWILFTLFCWILVTLFC
jgi:hypothetical protein